MRRFLFVFKVSLIIILVVLKVNLIVILVVFNVSFSGLLVDFFDILSVLIFKLFVDFFDFLNVLSVKRVCIDGNFCLDLDNFGFLYFINKNVVVLDFGVYFEYVWVDDVRNYE